MTLAWASGRVLISNPDRVETKISPGLRAQWHITCEQAPRLEENEVAQWGLGLMRVDLRQSFLSEFHCSVNLIQYRSDLYSHITVTELEKSG